MSKGPILSSSQHGKEDIVSIGPFGWCWFLWCSGVTESTTRRIGVVVRRKLVLNPTWTWMCVCVFYCLFPEGRYYPAGVERGRGDGGRRDGVGWYTKQNSQRNRMIPTSLSSLFFLFFPLLDAKYQMPEAKKKAKRRQQKPRPKLQKLQLPVVVKGNRSKGHGRWVWICCCLFVRS